MRKLSLAIITSTLLFGCATTANRTVEQDDPYYAPLHPEDTNVTQVNTGSLFNTHFSNDLYSDQKALRQGDIITVVLSESTQASKSAKTETDRETDYSLAPVTGLGGNPVTIKGDALQYGLSSEGSYKGDAKSDQSNSLRGNISVNVMRVLPNGNLMIRGEKWLTLNTGEEFIRLEGIVRPKDVTSENTVMSNRIANARIQYSGKGSLADAQEAGWLAQFFLSPLNPF